MPDPLEDLLREVTELRRRVHALETAPRAPWTTVSGGGVHYRTEDDDGMYLAAGISSNEEDLGFWVLNDGEAEGFLGSTALGTIPQFRMSNPDGTSNCIHAYDGELLFPGGICAFQKSPAAAIDSVGRPTTTSGTYVSLWYGFIPITGSNMFGAFNVNVPAATTAAARVVLLNAFTFAEEFVLWEQTGIVGATSTTISTTWAVPDGIRGTPGESSVGGTALVRFEARLTAGAGPVGIAPQYPLLCLT